MQTVNVRFVTAVTAPKDTNSRTSQAVTVWYRLKHTYGDKELRRFQKPAKASATKRNLITSRDIVENLLIN